MVKRVLFPLLFWIALIPINGCDLLNMDSASANYGVITISERTDLVPVGRLPNGKMVMKNLIEKSGGSNGVYSLSLTTDGSNSVTLVFASDASMSCVKAGSFCVVNATTGHPAISITDVSSDFKISMYRATTGTVHYESLSPLKIRFENVRMDPQSYSGNHASGSFRINGTISENK